MRKKKASCVQRLNHHLLFAPLRNQQVAVAENHFHRSHHSIEAARSATLLCQTDNTQWLFLSMFNHSHDLSRK